MKIPIFCICTFRMILIIKSDYFLWQHWLSGLCRSDTTRQNAGGNYALHYMHAFFNLAFLLSEVPLPVIQLPHPCLSRERGTYKSRIDIAWNIRRKKKNVSKHGFFCQMKIPRLSETEWKGSRYKKRWIPKCSKSRQSSGKVSWIIWSYLILFLVMYTL
jgi:hypothetical protein